MGYEAITGPNFIVPTAPAGDSSNRVADTAFVTAAVAVVGTTGLTLQTQYTQTASFIAFTTTMAGAVDTVPIKTDGTQILGLTITPTSTTNTLLITSFAAVTNSAGPVNMWMALFQDAVTSALAAAQYGIASPNAVAQTGLSLQIVAGTTGPTALKIRVGNFNGNVSTWAVNGVADPAGRRLGGSSLATLIVQETKV